MSYAEELADKIAAMPPLPIITAASMLHAQAHISDPRITAAVDARRAASIELGLSPDIAVPVHTRRGALIGWIKFDAPTEGPA